MRTLLLILFGMVLLSSTCKTPTASPPLEKDPEGAIQKLGLKKVKVMKRADALAAIRHALDPGLRRDYSIGLLPYDEMRRVMELGGFQKIYILRGNDPKSNEPLTIAAIYFAPTSDTPPGQSTLVYSDITVCPPPDGSTCLKDHLDIQYP